MHSFVTTARTQLETTVRDAQGKIKMDVQTATQKLGDLSAQSSDLSQI